jgi:hypothetical protein
MLATRWTAPADVFSAASHSPHWHDGRCARSWCSARSTIDMVSGWPLDRHCPVHLERDELGAVDGLHALSVAPSGPQWVRSSFSGSF